MLLPVVAMASPPPSVDYKRGGSISIAVPGLRAGTQLALIPGGPYLASKAALPNPALSVASDGAHAFVASGYSGLLIFDLTREKPPHLLAQLKGQGKIVRVALHDGYAFLADSVGMLLIVDVHDAQHPRQIANFPLTRQLDALCAEQDRVYWVSGKHLSILDVSQPQKPQLLADFTLSSSAVAVQAADGYAYLAVPKVGLSILDVHDPTHIHEVGKFRGTVRDVAVNQGHAYLANGEAGLTTLDVSDPHAPRWLGSVNHIGKLLELDSGDSQLAVRNDRSEILLFDVANPRLPRMVATYHAPSPSNAIAFAQKQVLSGADANLEVMDFSAPVPDLLNLGANFGGSRRAVIRDNILYVADWFSGLHLYDISDPHLPRHLSNYHTQGSSKGVLVRGDYAFVADDDHGVQILDISNPKQPYKISEVPTPGLAYTMKLVGDYLYLADHRGGFLIIDVADIAHPAVISSTPTAGKVWAVEVMGNLAYLAADKEGVLVLDISDPAHPRQVSVFDIDGAAEDIVIRDQLAYVASFDNGLHILDIGHPAQLREVSHFATPGNARGIQLVGQLAYIADWAAGIQIVDINNPAQPHPVGAYDTGGRSWGVLVQDHYAYVLDWWGGIIVLDISDPAAPTLAGAYHQRGLTRDIAVNEGHAFVADGENGLQIFDVNNPLNPIWMAGVDMKGDAQSVWVEDKTAYVAAGSGGLLAVDIGNPFEPKQLKQYPLQADLVRAQGNLVFVADRQRGVAIIDAVSGQKTAWYAARIKDMWCTPNRLLLATPDGVDILDLSNPAQPRSIQHLPGHAELLRLDKNLLVLYDQVEGFIFYDYVSLKLLGRFNPGEEVVDMQIQHGRLYASGKLSGLLVLDISDASHPTLKAAYPAASNVTRLSVYDGAAFLAGNDTLTEIRLLPDASIKRGRNGDVTVSVPKDMPLGSYHLIALDGVTGKRTTTNDVLRVVMPVSNKPRFSMKDLERAMRKRGLDPASHQ